MMDLSDMEEDDVIEQQFNRAAKYLQSIVDQLDQGTLLTLYGLYKQSTVGPCNTPKPGIFSMQARAKWNAWNDLKNVNKEAAMQSYIEQITQLRPDWDTFVTTNEKQLWVSVSRPKLDPEDELNIAECDKTLFDFVRQGNCAELDRFIDHNQSDLNGVDESGMCAIHWAADRGYSNVLKLLLARGCNVNQLDADGQTGLHYAASVGHHECVQLFLEFGADKSIRDNEGNNCLDVASDSIISNLLAN